MAKGKYHEWLTDDGLALVQGWARDGLKDEEIADNIGITTKTLYEWKNKYSAFCEALKKGKAPVDYHVEDALYKSATGYTVTVKKPVKLKTRKQLKDKGMIEEERIEYVEEEIYIRPDTTAQIYWLKNRRRGKWCDKPVDFDPGEKAEDDGFMEALNATAAEDWADEEAGL